MLKGGADKPAPPQAGVGLRVDVPVWPFVFPLLVIAALSIWFAARRPGILMRTFIITSENAGKGTGRGEKPCQQHSLEAGNKWTSCPSSAIRRWLN
jgi:hypothetical protein